MSAPAMNVRPAHVITIAATPVSAVAWEIPSRSPCRTCWLSALTGGLFTVITATRPRRSRSTDWVSAVMGLPRLGKVALIIRDVEARHGFAGPRPVPDADRIRAVMTDD